MGRKTRGRTGSGEKREKTYEYVSLVLIVAEILGRTSEEPRRAREEEREVTR